MTHYCIDANYVDTLNYVDAEDMNYPNYSNNAKYMNYPNYPNYDIDANYANTAYCVN